MLVLPAILADLRCIKSKQEALRQIQQSHFLDIQPEDWQPYESQSEPKWHTMIAWARKECVIREYKFDHDEKDSWGVTRNGITVFEKFRSRSTDGILDVRRCFLWSGAFKKKMCPTYAPSDRDAKRPKQLSLLDDFLD
jgi:hypothetical protein